MASAFLLSFWNVISNPIPAFFLTLAGFHPVKSEISAWAFLWVQSLGSLRMIEDKGILLDVTFIF